MKYLLIPNTSNPYDLNLLKSLAVGFQLMGHSASTLSIPLSPHHSDYTRRNLRAARGFLHAPGISFKDIFQNISADCVIEVNRFRSKHLNHNIRHISWFQDIRPTDFLRVLEYAKNIRSGDLIYLLGDKQHFGMQGNSENIKCLLSGISKDAIIPGHGFEHCKYDVNLLGYFSDLMDRQDIDLPFSRLEFLISEFLRSPRSVLKLLFSEECDFNLHKLQYDKTYINIEKGIISRYKPLHGEMLPPAFEQMNGNVNKQIINRLYTEIPRKMDRTILFEKLYELYKKGIKVLIAGKNWPDIFQGYSFVHPHVAHPAQIYQKSFMTIHNNTHGLGIHSRVLEAMAAGSFVMMHPSPHSRLPGGMDSTFEPDVNYGLYSGDNLVEKVKEWLADEDRRKKGIAENQKILLAKHLWEHRAEQILRDLK